GELREAIVTRMQRLYRWRIEPDWIVFLPGVVPGLHLAARHLVRADEHVLVPTPIYHHFKRAVELAPRAHDDVPLVLQGGRWVFDEARLAAAVRPGTRLLYLCNPQNPGGTIFTRAELERLARFAERHDLVICSDEIHADLLLDEGKPHLPIAALAPEISRRTVTLASPNKTFNFPGAGCAWAIVEDAALRRAFSADHHATVHDPSVFGYVAALAAYRDGDAWLAAQLEYLRGNRDLVQRAVTRMPGLQMAHVEATYLAWIDARGLGVADPQAHLLAHGVAPSPGAQFGAPGYVRLNFGTQRARLADALARMASAASSTRAR
ncbi:MAG: aminotransferase class I/II-fold pyridoxal phosphate-dependent enzyme, partial [Betaproteobacteria bacterium]|nr:aminotransferase class I/II-fold pyridoxal phosphate-dependent enzyme [Betaproteobacteria bacterium]